MRKVLAIGGRGVGTHAVASLLQQGTAVRADVIARWALARGL